MDALISGSTQHGRYFFRLGAYIGVWESNTSSESERRGSGHRDLHTIGFAWAKGEGEVWSPEKRPHSSSSSLTRNPFP